MSIRLYQPMDADALIEVFQSAIGGAAARDYDAEQIKVWSATPEREAWARRCARKPTFVARVGDTIAGFSDLETDGHIDMLFVHADWQGRGVATALLQHIRRTALQAGLSTLHAEVSLTARSVFERAGFIVLAPQTVAIGQTRFTNFRMQARLA